MILKQIRNNQQIIKSGAVLITGANSGIGRATALRLAGMGFEVFAGVRREADAAQLQQEGGERISPVLLDVTDAAQIEAAVALVETRIAPRGLVGLVNNAGIAGGGPLEYLPLEEVRQVFEVNLIGVLAVTQAFFPLLRRGTGRIINISSIAGRSATPFLGPYAASKHALEAVSDSLRVELLPWDIHVCLIEPGEVATPIWEKGLAIAERVLAVMPPLAQQRYGPAFDFMRRRIANSAGIDPAAVADPIIQALTVFQPKARYLVGRDAQIQSAVEKLPTAVRDQLILSQLPPYGEHS